MDHGPWSTDQNRLISNRKFRAQFDFGSVMGALILETEMLVTISPWHIGHQHVKSTNNISKMSPTETVSINGHQHWCSRNFRDIVILWTSSWWQYLEVSDKIKNVDDQMNKTVTSISNRSPTVVVSNIYHHLWWRLVQTGPDWSMTGPQKGFPEFIITNLKLPT